MILANTTDDMNGYGAKIDQSLRAMDEAEKKLDALADGEGKTKLKEFTDQWRQFVDTDKKVREIAMLNSNVRAQALSRTEGAPGPGYRCGHSVGPSSPVREAVQRHSRCRNGGRDRGLGRSERAGHSPGGKEHDSRNRPRPRWRNRSSRSKMQQAQLTAHLAELDKRANPEEQAKLAQFRSAWSKFMDVHAKVRQATFENGNAEATKLSIDQGPPTGRSMRGSVWTPSSRRTTRTWTRPRPTRTSNTPRRGIFCSPCWSPPS